MSAVEVNPARIFAVGPSGGCRALKSEGASAIRFPPFRIECSPVLDMAGGPHLSLTRVCAAFASEESFDPFHTKVEIEANQFDCPMAGILPYIGGKNRLANEIIALFPHHHTYVEAFAGGASTFFRKQPSKVEVLNDLDGEVTNLFRVCQLHHEELVRYMRWMVSSRDWFKLLEHTDTSTLTDIQRAARTIYLQKNAYAGMVRRHSFNPGVLQPTGFNIERLPEIVAKTHERLARVAIESLPYEQVLKRYDRDTTLFFLDPPYYGRKLYNFNFEHEDFVTMAERLSKLKGKFILSLNDMPEVRSIFSHFKIHGVELHYTAQKTPGKRFKEILITNF